MTKLSCINCRKLKVGCDRSEPVCRRCYALGKECGYPARKRRKEPQKPQSSRVNEFEARLVRMESQFVQKKDLLKADFGRDEVENQGDALDEREEWEELAEFKLPWRLRPERLRSGTSAEPNLLSAQEALPDAQLQHDLYYIYFQQVHPSAPMIHKSRFYRALTGIPSHAPPLALRYAMWAVAASETTKHQDIAEDLYTLGRKYAEEIEMKSAGQHLLSPSSAQCWYLLAVYEASQAYFTRAWMSVGRCVRLVQMMTLHRLGSPHDKEHMLPQPSSWTEMEEWRRTFWAAYFADRWASAISGQPLSIKDVDIRINLPSSEEAFEREIEEVGISLEQANAAESIPDLSPYAGVVFTTAMLGRCLDQILPQVYHGITDVDNGEYWVTHRKIDTCISHTFMNLPAHLHPSHTAKDVNLIFLHLNLHVMVILLHQTAIRMATKHKLDPSIREKSFQRCLVSSREMKNIIYSVKDLKSFPVSIWASFCVYVAAGIFIDDIRSTDLFSNSSVDLGLLVVALKLIGTRQQISNFFVRKLESDIFRTGVGSYIPDDLRRVAGISAV